MPTTTPTGVRAFRSSRGVAIARSQPRASRLTAIRTARCAARPWIAAAATHDGEEEEVLEPEDEFLLEEVQGSSLKSLNSPLGKAVSDACDELEQLASLEREVQREAFAILDKLTGKQTPTFGDDDDRSSGKQ